MSAIKSIKAIADQKGYSMDYLATMTGYKLPHHLKRVLINTPKKMGAEKIHKLSKVLDIPVDKLIMLLVNGK